MELELAGRVALVLGAGGGLGSAIIRELAHEGCRVAAVDVDKNALQRTLSTLGPGEQDAYAITWDMNDVDAAPSVAERARNELGPVDVLVNITGGPPPTTVHDQSAETWARHFHSMVLSVIKLADCLVPHMVEQRWGRILTSTSSGVVAPIPNLGLSNSLRSALVGWSKTLAGEVSHAGVTCNVIVPGRIYTPRIKALDEARAEREGRSVEDVVAASTSLIPARRYGDPTEFAKVAAFLVSGPASYITGSMIRVDGGLVPSV